MNIPKIKSTHLPYVAIAAALALAGLAAARQAQVRRPSLNADFGQQAGVGASVNAEGPKVTINGQPVDLGTDGKAEITTDSGATVNVDSNSTTVTSGGGRTVITNEDGSVDIKVESRSSNGDSETDVDYDNDSTFKFKHDASIEVETR